MPSNPVLTFERIVAFPGFSGLIPLHPAATIILYRLQKTPH